jgi:hypothetical protein
MPTRSQPGNRRAAGPGHRELQLWTDFFGTGSCLVASAAGAAPRILASVRLGRIGIRPFPGEPQKGFRPPRMSARARLVRESGFRGEASTTFTGGAASPGAASFFGTASCRAQAASDAIFGSRGWVAPVFVARKGGGPGRQRTVAASVRNGAWCRYGGFSSDDSPSSPHGWPARMRPLARRTSKGNKAHGRTGRPTAGNGRGSSELDGGATPRSRRGGLAELAGVCWQRRASSGRAGASPTARGQRPR